MLRNYKNYDAQKSDKRIVFYQIFFDLKDNRKILTTIFIYVNI